MAWGAIKNAVAFNSPRKHYRIPAPEWPIVQTLCGPCVTSLLSFSPSLKSPVPGICLGLETQLDVNSGPLLIHQLFYHPAFSDLKENASQRN